MNVALIGLRGSGKSTVGRLLAARTGRPFIDLDDVVLAEFAEPTVTAVWAGPGEPAWRRAEAEILRRVLEEPGQVVALGGGTAMIESARGQLEAEAAAGRVTIVYLRCTAAELALRLAGEAGDRPPLTELDPRREVDAVFAARDPVYRALATVTVDVGGLEAGQVVEAVERLLA